MLSSIRKMYEIYYFMKKITLIIMEGAQFDPRNLPTPTLTLITLPLHGVAKTFKFRHRSFGVLPLEK